MVWGKQDCVRISDEPLSSTVPRAHARPRGCDLTRRLVPSGWCCELGVLCCMLEGFSVHLSHPALALVVCDLRGKGYVGDVMM